MAHVPQKDMRVEVYTYIYIYVHTHNTTCFSRGEFFWDYMLHTYISQVIIFVFVGGRAEVRVRMRVCVVCVLARCYKKFVVAHTTHHKHTHTTQHNTLSHAPHTHAHAQHRG